VLEGLITLMSTCLIAGFVAWVLLDEDSKFYTTVIEALVTIMTVSLVVWAMSLTQEGFSLSMIEYSEMLIILATVFIVIRFLRKYASTRKQLDQYIKNDFSIQEGWSPGKLQALKEGINAGHDLERLSKTLHHSEASVRGKLVSSKLYDQYLERQVDLGEAKFEEWRKLRRKIGKVLPIRDFEPTDPEHEALPPDWKMVQSLSENWFDPRLEFCETFYTSPVSKLADPRVQHDVVKHVAAFLNTAGGHVLIGFGKQGKLLGLLDDDIRTMHHYQRRLDETLRKTLGDKASLHYKTHMIRWGSEDVCLIVCEKADFENSDNVDYEVSCVHQKYNEIMGYEKRQNLLYRRLNAQALHDPVSPMAFP
jgi:hypothetical protein